MLAVMSAIGLTAHSERVLEMESGITLERAVELMLQYVKLSVIQCPLTNSLGRIVSQNIYSAIEQPPFDRSPLDGYALRSEDTIGASKTSPVHLEVTEIIYAGATPQHALKRGQAARIMTGAPVPKGADCILRQEDTDCGFTQVKIYSQLNSSSNIVYRGEDFKAGDLLFKKGTKLEAGSLAVAALAGITNLPVYSLPSVRIISTGDELCCPGVPLKNGQIYDSNSVYITSRLKQLGIPVLSTEIVGDKISKLKESLSQKCDLTITTGGVSVGEKDLIPQALQELGAEIIFHKLAIKPGSPALFAILDGRPVLSLSGNPFAAAATFELLARPMLSAMCKDKSIDIKVIDAILQTSFEKGGGRRFLRAFFKDGMVTLPTGHSSGQLSSIQGCNCLAEIKYGPVASGTNIKAVIL